MKKPIKLLLALTLGISLCACGSNPSEQTADPSSAAEATGQTASEPPISGTVAVLS